MAQPPVPEPALDSKTTETPEEASIENSNVSVNDATAQSSVVKTDAVSAEQHPAADTTEESLAGRSASPPNQDNEPSHPSDEIESIPALSDFSVGLSVCSTGGLGS